MMQMMYVVMTAGAVMLGAAGANEMTHGGFAQAMGVGHHHMADYGGYHCAGPNDADWARHVDHMHGGSTDFEDHCNSSHMDRDHAHVGDGANGPMGPGHAGAMA